MTRPTKTPNPIFHRRMKQRMEELGKQNGKKSGTLSLVDVATRMNQILYGTPEGSINKGLISKYLNETNGYIPQREDYKDALAAALECPREWLFAEDSSGIVLQVDEIIRTITFKNGTLADAFGPQWAPEWDVYLAGIANTLQKYGEYEVPNEDAQHFIDYLSAGVMALFKLYKGEIKKTEFNSTISKALLKDEGR